MPKRMISTDISISERVEACSEWAQLLFDRIIAHQDDWGRLTGEPGKVKVVLKPHSRRPVRSFANALAELASQGLICWYEVENEKAMALKPESCAEYQAGIHDTAVARGRKSKYGPPPDPLFRWPEDGPIGDDQRRSAIIGLNLTQPNLTQEKTKESADTSGACVSRHSELKGFYVSEFERRSNGEKAPFTAADGVMLSRRLKQCEREHGAEGWRKVKWVIEHGLKGDVGKLPNREGLPMLRTILSEGYWTEITTAAARRHNP